MNEDIYRTLRERIIYLVYDPGQILKEQVLAKEFGVSRTPLRTVLFRLEWEHLVKILPRTGILVAELELNQRQTLAIPGAIVGGRIQCWPQCGLMKTAC